MSNRRRPVWQNKYRIRYLRSPAWFARRDRWFELERQRVGEVRCALCQRVGESHTLELHHLDYHGVIQGPSGWAAHERHRDLMALHPRCHEALHQLIDRDRALSALASRRAASFQALVRLRARLPIGRVSADDSATTAEE